MRRIALFLICLGFSSFSIAQDSCTVMGRFKTDYLGNETDRLALPLLFSLTKDSVYISPPTDGDLYQPTKFKIISKACDAKTTDSTNKIRYKVFVSESPDLLADFNIIMQNGKVLRFELLYGDSEKRIF